MIQAEVDIHGPAGLVVASVHPDDNTSVLVDEARRVLDITTIVVHGAVMRDPRHRDRPGYHHSHANINRPTIGHAPDEQETLGSIKTWLKYRAVLRSAARGPLKWYVEVHSNDDERTQDRVEIAGNITADQAKAIKQAWVEAFGDELYPAVEPVDELRVWRAEVARVKGSYALARHWLQIEIPEVLLNHLVQEDAHRHEAWIPFFRTMLQVLGAPLPPPEKQREALREAEPGTFTAISDAADKLRSWFRDRLDDQALDIARLYRASRDRFTARLRTIYDSFLAGDPTMLQARRGPGAAAINAAVEDTVNGLATELGNMAVDRIVGMGADQADAISDILEPATELSFRDIPISAQNVMNELTTRVVGGGTFMDRLFHQSEEFRHNLYGSLRQSLISGDDFDAVRGKTHKLFGVDKLSEPTGPAYGSVKIYQNEARRQWNLLMGEKAEEADADQVWWAKLDERSTPGCVARHGRLIDDIGDSPPRHYNCRCQILPVEKGQDLSSARREADAWLKEHGYTRRQAVQMESLREAEFDPAEHPRGPGGEFVGKGVGPETAEGFEQEINKTDNFHRRSNAAWIKNLSPGEREGIGEYLQEFGFEAVNQYARTGTIPPGHDKTLAQVRGYVQGIDSALNKATTVRTLSVYRGFVDEPGQYAGLKPGDTFAARGYTSTSADDVIAENYASGMGVVPRGATMMTVDVPKGQRAGYVEGLRPRDIDPAAKNLEFLLPRGTSFEVVSNAVRKDGVRDLHVKVTGIKPERSPGIWLSISEADFDPEEHPRDPSGEFARKGGPKIELSPMNAEATAKHLGLDYDKGWVARGGYMVGRRLRPGRRDPDDTRGARYDAFSPGVTGRTVHNSLVDARAEVARRALNLPEKTTEADFDPAQHPRGAGGQFAPKGTAVAGEDPGSLVHAAGGIFNGIQDTPSGKKYAVFTDPHSHSTGMLPLEGLTITAVSAKLMDIRARMREAWTWGQHQLTPLYQVPADGRSGPYKFVSLPWRRLPALVVGVMKPSPVATTAVEARAAGAPDHVLLRTLGSSWEVHTVEGWQPVKPKAGSWIETSVGYALDGTEAPTWDEIAVRLPQDLLQRWPAARQVTFPPLPSKRLYAVRAVSQAEAEALTLGEAYSLGGWAVGTRFPELARKVLDPTLAATGPAAWGVSGPALAVAVTVENEPSFNDLRTVVELATGRVLYARDAFPEDIQAPYQRVAVVAIEPEAHPAWGMDPDGAAPGYRVWAIRPRGHAFWSLPGGHIDPGETPAAAAAREMAEETGVRVKLVRSLGHLYRPWSTTEVFLGRRVGPPQDLTAADEIDAVYTVDPLELETAERAFVARHLPALSHVD